MIQKYVDAFVDRKADIKARLRKAHPESYKELVAMVVEAISDEEDGSPDHTRIHEVDEGDYQGTLLYVVAARGYQPADFWTVKVTYGSCSGCDTLQGIREYSDEVPTEQQVDDYMTLALHVVQQLKEVA